MGDLPEEIREALALWDGNADMDGDDLEVIAEAARAYADILEKAEPGRAIGVIFDDDWGLTADEDALVLAVPSHAWSTNPGRYLVVPVEDDA